MNYEDQDEAMQSLIGHSILDWGRDETMFHVVLDDGRILIFMGMGIVLAGDHAIH